MAFVPFENVCQFAVRFSEQGQLVENVYHYQTTVPWTPATMVAQCSLIKSAWIANFSGLVTYQLVMTSIMARELSDESGLAVEWAANVPNSGSDTDGGAPMNVTLAIKWITGLAGRSFRGRTYHLGIINNQIVDSRVTSGIQSALQAAYSTFLVNTNEADPTMVVASRRTLGVDRGFGVATPIIGCVVNDVTDSQRRRLPGRGS